MNCHDSRIPCTAARRLLRDGTDSGAVAEGGRELRRLEETCYQCHSATFADGCRYAAGEVKNIASGFRAGAKRMPITGGDQRADDPRRTISWTADLAPKLARQSRAHGAR